MYLKIHDLIFIAGLLAPVGVAAQSTDGFSTADDWRAHFDQLCLTGEAGLPAASSMFGIADRVGAEAARRYCDCFADEAIAFYADRGVELGMGRRFQNASRSGDRACFPPFDDGSPRFDTRTMPYEQRQALLEAVAAP
jgi:hypothetical protein